jgi:N6-adenosine-specific RNA methylase IME4
MANELKLYDAARDALSEAVRIDEVMSIRTQAAAFAAYARQAKDTDLIEKATELRLRAERKAGQLLAAMKKSGERQSGGRPPAKVENGSGEHTVSNDPLKLEDLGISKFQSSRWQNVAALPEKEFAERIAQTQRLATQSVEMTPFERAQEKKTKRAAREVELGTKQRALPNAKFGLILADPEWAYEVYSQETGMDRAAANYYPTSSLEEIAARDVGSLAAEDCVLWLWTTVPMLSKAIRIMEDNWGFEYKSNYVWGKDRAGTGYWSRNKHEHLLIGTRGKIPCPAPGTQWDSLIHAAVTDHSAKPEIFLEMLEEYYPSLPRIELNRRGPARANWSAWGLESE